MLILEQLEECVLKLEAENWDFILNFKRPFQVHFGEQWTPCPLANARYSHHLRSSSQSNKGTTKDENVWLTGQSDFYSSSKDRRGITRCARIAKVLFLLNSPSAARKSLNKTQVIREESKQSTMMITEMINPVDCLHEMY